MNIIDLLIVVGYFIIILTIGLWAGREESDTREFFLAHRKIPWPAALCSIIATEISAATFLGTPGTGFSENLNYLQFEIGSITARVLIAILFLGVFFKYDVVTIYEFLARRFGDQTRYAATLFFFATRLLASGVRLMIAATGLAMVFDWPFQYTILLFVTVTIIYTSFGGIKAIIWTDVIQAFMFVGAGLGALIFLYYQIPGGWTAIHKIASETGHLQVLRLSPSGGSSWSAWFNDPTLFWVAALNGLVTTFAALGTDQDMTQRLLTCKDVHASRKSIIASGLIGPPITLLFLSLGVFLFVFYQTNPDPQAPTMLVNGAQIIDSDKIFPYFIRHGLPVGLRGLLIIGVLSTAMGSLASALGALSSSAVVDIYKPLLNRNATEKQCLWIARLNIILFGIILSAIAWILKDAHGFLWLCFKIGGITYGALLGIFLLGILTKVGTNRGNLISMISSSSIVATLLILIETGKIHLAWTWLILIGAGWTFGLGYLFGALERRAFLGNAEAATPLDSLTE